MEQSFTIGNEALEVIRKYIYVGHVVTANSDHKREITRSIRMRWTAFGTYSQVMNASILQEESE